MDESLSSDIEIYPVHRVIHLLYNWGHVLPENRFHIQQNKYCIIFLSYYSCEGHIFAAMCSLGGGDGGWLGLLLTAVCGS